MFKVTVAFLGSGLLTASIIPRIITFSRRLKLFDDQDLYRKTHLELVSRMGGIPIFIGYILVVHLYSDLRSISFHALIASLIIIFSLGLKDDLLGGAVPYEKITAQLLAIIILVIFNGQSLNLDLHSDEATALSKLRKFALPVVLMLFIVNAFNFIDGINGLAGVLGVLINVFVGSYLIMWGENEFGVSAFIIAGSTAGFLIYNFSPGKVFMGDSGAMIIGLITGAMCLRFINMSHGNSELQFSSPIMIVCSLLIVPTFDVLRIFFIRAIHGRPLLIGDRNHIHHRLCDLGMRDYQAVLILILFTVICLFTVILGEGLGLLTISAALFSLCTISNTVLSYLRGRCHSSSYKFSDVLFIDTLNRR
jgi:UDP-GlcNAc:undecaprenyl-phosphate GlcNAc-1-phosphate transferase